MVLSLLEEQKYVLDVQAASKLPSFNLVSKVELDRVLQSAKVANRILTDENYYLILQETKRFYPYQSRPQHQVEYADRLGWREYVHEGVLGLHEAIIRFEIEKGFRLSTFAISWIRGSLSRLNKKEALINISYEQVEKYSLSCDRDLETISISSQELNLILDFVDTLNPVDKDIINRCFGLNNYRKNSLIAIGRCNNLTPKQVARRRDRIIKQLRSLLNSEKTEQNKALFHCISNDISLLAA